MLTLKGLRNYNRYQAAFGHFAISLIIFAILGYLVYFCWYPQPLFAIDAGWQGLRIIAFVDFVLGPFITLFIFNPKKKELFKDLAIIALIQASALSYGVYHVYQSRPAFVVYADNAFYTVAASELEHFPLSNDILAEVSIIKPIYKILDIPREKHSIEYAVKNDDFTNYEKLQDIRIQSSGRKTPYYLLEELLKPYNPHITTLNENSYNLETILKDIKDPIEKQELDNWLKQNPSYKTFSYTSVVGRFGTVIVQVNPKTGKPENYIPVNYHDGYL